MNKRVLAEQRVLNGTKRLRSLQIRKYFELSYGRPLVNVLKEFVAKVNELKAENDRLRKELEEERGLRNKLKGELEREISRRKGMERKSWEGFSPALPFGEGAKKWGSETATIGGVIFHSPGRKIEEALAKAEEKIGNALNSESKEDSESKDIKHVELDDFDDPDLATIKKLEAEDTRVIYPNLKYAKPKYQNVSEILKYVESKEDKGGVKLVIMNFND